MRVLWLCNKPFVGAEEKGTGTWLGSMAQGLLSNDDNNGFALGVISLGQTSQVIRQGTDQVPQWLVPGRFRPGRDGLPGRAVLKGITDAVAEFRPDVIHIWGTEFYWGLLTARGILGQPSLLGMQGLIASLPPVYAGGLSWREQLACIGPKEVLRLRTLGTVARRYARWADREEEIIRGHCHIAYQSPWIAARVRAISPSAHLYKTEPLLRPVFYAAEPWTIPNEHSIFCTAAGPAPYKGLHIAIRALALLKRDFPAIRLRIAGTHQRRGIRRDGYISWVSRLAAKLGTSESIDWLGAIDADQIVSELRRASCVLIPTFVESYCVAMMEAMCVGTPAVVSYTGGTSYLGSDENTCLFSLPGDAEMCAFQVHRVIEDRDLAMSLSRAARRTAALRHDPATVCRQQLEMYRLLCQGSTAAAIP